MVPRILQTVKQKVHMEASRISKTTCRYQVCKKTYIALVPRILQTWNQKIHIVSARVNKTSR